MRCPFEVVITCDSSGENWAAASWDPCTGSLLSTYKNDNLALGHHSLQLLSDSYLIASNATKSMLHLWPLNSQTQEKSVRLFTPGKVTALSCTPSGSYIAAAVNEKLYIWQTCNGRLVKTFTKHYQPVSCMTFNGDGSCLASGAEDGLIFVWSLSQLANEQEAKPLASFSHHSLPVKDLQFGKTGNFGRLYSVSLDRSARVYDVYTSQLLLTLVFDVPLMSVCTDILESQLFVGSSTGVVMKCNLRDPPRGVEHHVSINRDKLLVFKGHESSITSLSVSVDCITLLTGSTDGMVHLWDIPSCQIIRSLKHKAPIVSAFFATAFDNFKVNTLKPSLQIRPLQKSSEQAKKEFLEIYRKDEDDSWILEFGASKSNSYASKASNSSDHEKELEEARSEIQRLKKINSDLYQYCAKNILKSKDATRT